MRILGLNGTGGEAVAALVGRDGQGVHLVREAATPRQADRQGGGGSERLAGMLRSLLEQAGWQPGSLGLIAAVTGPGSFTGLRASLSLAHGVALGSGAKLCGVSVPEALRRSVPEEQGRPLWCVGLLRCDRVFLQRHAHSASLACLLEALPVPEQPVLLAGDASALVAATIKRAIPTGVTRDPPEAKRPAAGLRPHPA